MQTPPRVRGTTERAGCGATRRPHTAVRSQRVSGCGRTDAGPSGKHPLWWWHFGRTADVPVGRTADLPHACISTAASPESPGPALATLVLDESWLLRSPPLRPRGIRYESRGSTSDARGV